MYAIKQGASFMRVTRRGPRRLLVPRVRIADATHFQTAQYAQETAVRLGCRPKEFFIVEVTDGDRQ
jgi:hypothetical protein